jgi:hypothetical protein
VVALCPFRLARNYVHQAFVLEELARFGVSVKPRRATRSGLGSCLPPSSRPRQPNIWYATAADALHRCEPFGHVTGADRRQRTIQSGTQQFVADHAAGRQ